MKFKPGDFVRFVEERREGYVTKIINDQLVTVTDTDDFEIPVPASKITHVHGHINENSLKVNIDIPVEEIVTTGIYLALIPDQQKKDSIVFHLINITTCQVLCNVYSEKGNRQQGEYAGIINPRSFVEIYSNFLSGLQNWPELTFQFLFHTRNYPEPLEPLTVKRKFRAKDFSNTKKSAPLMNQHAWLMQLDEPMPLIDPVKLKESFFKPAEERRAPSSPHREVDLHIEKLDDNYAFLSRAEILEIQLKHFHNSLDNAIVHKQNSIIFIHGVGNGTLKNEIHKFAGKHPQVKTFMDARKEKFGYGATEIFFK